MKTTDLIIGIAGEHLVCADLLSMGYAAFMASQNCPYDVAVQVGTRLVRVQVKTAKSAKPFLQKRQDHIIGYTWWVRQGKGGLRAYQKDAFDVIALVGLATKQIAYLDINSVKQTMQIPISGHRKTTSKSFSDYTFDKAIQ